MGTVPTTGSLRYARCPWLEMSCANGRSHILSRLTASPSLSKTCAPGLHLGPISNRALLYLQSARRRSSASTQERGRCFAPRSTKPLPSTVRWTHLPFLNAVLELSTEMRAGRPSPRNSKASNMPLEDPSRREKWPSHHRHRLALLRESRHIIHPASTLPHPRIAADASSSSPSPTSDQNSSFPTSPKTSKNSSKNLKAMKL